MKIDFLDGIRAVNTDNKQCLNMNLQAILYCLHHERFSSHFTDKNIKT